MKRLGSHFNFKNRVMNCDKTWLKREKIPISHRHTKNTTLNQIERRSKQGVRVRKFYLTQERDALLHDFCLESLIEKSFVENGW